MPIPTSDFKAAAIKCLNNNGMTVDDAVNKLIRMPRGAAFLLTDSGGVQYSYHVLGQSVNFELWARRGAESVAYEIGFVSDH